MTGVRGHLAPAMPCQQAIHHRGLDRLAQPLRQCGSNRGNHHQVAGGGAGQPRFQERGFLLRGQQGLSPSAPVARRTEARRASLAKGGLKPRHGRPAHAQNGGGLFEGGPEQGRQQNRLSLAQGFDGRCGRRSELRPLDDLCISPARSCHALTIARSHPWPVIPKAKPAGLCERRAWLKFGSLTSARRVSSPRSRGFAARSAAAPARRCAAPCCSSRAPSRGSGWRWHSRTFRPAAHAR